MFLSYLFCITTGLLTLSMLRLYFMMWNTESTVREIQRQMKVNRRVTFGDDFRNGRFPASFFDNIAQPEKPNGKGQ